jgi:hypothetical protein
VYPTKGADSDIRVIPETAKLWYHPPLHSPVRKSYRKLPFPWFSLIDRFTIKFLAEHLTAMNNKRSGG